MPVRRGNRGTVGRLGGGRPPNPQAGRARIVRGRRAPAMRRALSRTNPQASRSKIRRPSLGRGLTQGGGTSGLRRRATSALRPPNRQATRRLATRRPAGGRISERGTVSPARRRNPQAGRATRARAPARLRAAVSAARRTPQITRRGARLGGPTPQRRANPQRRRRY